MMGKDWSGNKKTVFSIMGASSHSQKERVQNDFYATSPQAIDILLEYPGLKLPDKIWEPSCGAGHLSRRLIEHGYDVVSTDIVNHGYGTSGVNFFEQIRTPDGIRCILTNPPYKFATEYVHHALSILPDDGYLCLFLKTTFAEGQERFKRVFSITPPHIGITMRQTRPMRP